jgi:copper chaperone
MKFSVETMTCGGCARSVTKAIQALDSAAQVTPDVPGRTVAVQSDRPAQEIAAALSAAGYPAVEREPARATER